MSDDDSRSMIPTRRGIGQVYRLLVELRRINRYLVQLGVVSAACVEPMRYWHLGRREE